jgi:DNA polymerase III subunit gamma/tau
MQNQSLSDAILLYDEINRKGFEGDLVLNGFAEFLRNLLVSKDPKVAMLLEVSEGFKKRYLDTAKNIEAGWLLSALNILNESEINYRMAKNKRLHVELTFIKLCYLNQALELVNENGQLGKKKQLESLKAVSFKAITAVPERLKSDSSKLSSSPKNPAPSKENKKANGENVRVENEAILVIEEEVMKPKLPKAAADHTAVVKPAPKFTRLTSLEKIREKVALEHKNNQVLELNEEELYVAWGLYIEELVKNKNYPAVSNFKQASLNILEGNCIEIVTNNPLQQKFIEAERGALISHLQAHFNNRFLTYKIIMVPEENKNEIREEHLSTKQQYLKVIEEYPLVKQLKDRLGLQLDY